MLRPKPSRRRLPRRRRVHPLLLLRRRPRLWWGLVASVAVTAGLSASSLVERAEQAREAWGTTVAVLVATRDLAPGDPLSGGSVVVERRPLATVPSSALTAVPESRVAGAGIVAGEIVVAERVAGAGLRGPAAMVPVGSRAMAVPVEPGLTPPLEVGDRVDVVVALGSEVAEGAGGPPGFTLVPGARVVHVGEEAITIAVPENDAPRLAVALGMGAVMLALVGAG